MKGGFEMAMTAFGRKIGTPSIQEAAYCLVAVAGIALAVVFMFVAFAMFPMDTAVLAQHVDVGVQQTVMLSFAG